ncbi:putative NADH-ubiquinone oxidoreductase 30.4 kDa subunit [Yarrowia sp. C11]|nr:putative NADH-ubiquinone oxidoreductase 30.4 kDa subunit [Yarrowia sp. C11]KAG5364989.1 putative NADH-ubiquinone oxidoreductase 30.4 kDa subunit [Yarrowia sp. E02]
MLSRFARIGSMGVRPVAAARATFVTSARAAQAAPSWQNIKDVRLEPKVHVDEVFEPIVNPADRYLQHVSDLHQYAKYIMAALPKYIQGFSVWKDELTLHVAPSAVIPVTTFLRDNTSTQYKSIIDITAVDYPSRENRFEVVYNFLSVRHNSRIRLKTYATELTPVPSITCLYEGANWFEREAYDMYGVFFEGHPDLRRIMTDYGFEGHPLRKDFPLTGYTEVRWDEEKRRVVYEPLELTQAFRNFSAGSTAWEPVGPGRDDRPDSFKLPTPKPEEKEGDKK